MKRGNVTILASISIMLLVAMGVGAGTMAWFSQTEEAAITITSGNVDLLLSKTGEDASWYNGLAFDFPTGWAPGDDYTILVYMKNVGNAGSKTVWVYGEDIVDPGGLSYVIFITDVAYTDDPNVGGGGHGYWWDGHYWIHPGGGTYYADNNQFGGSDGKLSLIEFATADVNANEYMRFYWGTWFEKDYLEASGASIQGVKLTFHFDEEADNEYQNKVCNFDIVFLATDDQGYGLIWPPP